MPVTRKQAEKVLEAIKTKHQAHWLDTETGKPWGTPPKLIENWDYLDSGPTRWAIVWEEGPFEWAYGACSGGFDEEYAAMYSEEYGREATTQAARDGKFNIEPVAVPEKVWLEPVTTWAVGIYES